MDSATLGAGNAGILINIFAMIIQREGVGDFEAS